MGIKNRMANTARQTSSKPIATPTQAKQGQKGFAETGMGGGSCFC
jgi:hypothetical protein